MLTRLIVDCTTGESTEVELTAEELAEREAAIARDAEEKAKQETEEQVKAAAKQAAQNKLKALGLSDIEIAALVGA